MTLVGHTTERLIFEKVSLNHFDQWLKFFEDPQTSIHWKEDKESPLRECEKWYQNQLIRYAEKRGGMNALIEKTSGQLVGHAGLLLQMVDQQPEWEIAYSLLPTFWRRGFAHEAVQYCKEVGFVHGVAESFISIISKTNLPSQKVAIKNGMTIQKETTYKGNEVFIFRAYRVS